MHKNLVIVFLAVFTPLIGGCGPAESPVPPPPTPTSSELLASWLEIPKGGMENLDVVSAQTIAVQLKQSGPAGVNPLLDVMGDPDAAPIAKVLAVISLTPLTAPEMAPRIMEIAAPGNESTSRACATQLLGTIDAPDVTAYLKGLSSDPERRVRAVAVMVLIARADADALAGLTSLWKDPTTTPQERDQLVQSIPVAHMAEHMDIYRAALVDYEMNIPARRHAAQILGQLGGAEAIEVLAKGAETEPAPDVRSVIQAALDAVRSRTGNAVPTASPETES